MGEHPTYNRGVSVRPGPRARSVVVLALRVRVTTQSERDEEFERDAARRIVSSFCPSGVREHISVMTDKKLVRSQPGTLLLPA